MARPCPSPRSLAICVVAVAAVAAGAAGLQPNVIVESPNGPLLCVGTYAPADEKANGQPVWKRLGGDPEDPERWLFYDPLGNWAIGGEDVKDSGFQTSNGWIYSPAATGSEVPMPWEMADWRRFNGTAHVMDPGIKVTPVGEDGLDAQAASMEKLTRAWNEEAAETNTEPPATSSVTSLSATRTATAVRSATTTGTLSPSTSSKTATSITTATKTITDTNTATTTGTTGTTGTTPATTATTTTTTTTATTATSSTTTSTKPVDPAAVLDCRQRVARHQEWCNVAISLDRRAASLTAALTVAEKVTLFIKGPNALENTRLRSDSGHGHASAKGTSEFATAFPRPVGLASSFNDTLFEAVGRALGAEARDRVARGFGELTLRMPDVNLIRDPRGGRGHLAGEDPLLAGTYGASFIRGAQADDADELFSSTCLQHAAWTSVSARDMADTYMLPFEASVREGRPSCLAGCYHTGASDKPGAARDLHVDVARSEWGFDGYVLNDCVASAREPSGQSVNEELQAGADCTSTSASNKTAASLAKSAVVNSTLLDSAVQRLLRVQLRLGLFGEIAMEETPGHPAARAHHALAKQAADQSLVLLKNRGDVLPLSPESPPTIAVIGPYANASTEMYGGPARSAPFVISPIAGICLYAAPSFADGANISAAVELVAKTDVIVLVVGLRWDESEDPDRPGLSLPGNQQELVGEVAAAAELAGKRVVMVIMSAGPIDLTAMRDLAVPQAILWAGYPGQCGGASIADVIFGAVSPTGRLTQTWYPEGFTEKADTNVAGMRPDVANGLPGRTYRFYTGQAVFPFGFGLTYTKFRTVLSVSTNNVDVKEVQPPPSAAARGAALVTASVEVQNVGRIDGDEVVLLFAAPPPSVAGVQGAPLRTLAGYRRVHVKAGKSASVKIELGSRDFSVANDSGEFAAVTGRWRVWVGTDGLDRAETICVDQPEVQLRSLAAGPTSTRRLCVDEPIRNLFA